MIFALVSRDDSKKCIIAGPEFSHDVKPAICPVDVPYHTYAWMW